MSVLIKVEQDDVVAVYDVAPNHVGNVEHVLRYGRRVYFCVRGLWVARMAGPAWRRTTRAQAEVLASLPVDYRCCASLI